MSAVPTQVRAGSDPEVLAKATRRCLTWQPSTLWIHFEPQNVGDKAIRGHEVRYLESYERYRLEGEEGVSLSDVHLFRGDWTETWAVCHGDVPADVADPGKLYIAT